MYENYQKVVDKNILLSKEDMYFKSDPEYMVILEHVSQQQGEEYLNTIIREFTGIYANNKEYLLNLCCINDSCGKPLKKMFYTFGECSPTNLRYIYHSLLILNYMVKKNINNVNIVEIGGGYGGLCFFVSKLAFIFNINIVSYTIFDLPGICKLQEKYLKSLDINAKTCQLENKIDLQKESFLISNYAFSEFDKKTQEEYTNKVLNPYTSNGFLAWNHIELYNFIENKKITSETERPITGHYNKFVYFEPI